MAVSQGPQRLQPLSSGHDGRLELCPAADMPGTRGQELALAEWTGVALPGPTPLWAALGSQGGRSTVHCAQPVKLVWHGCLRLDASLT